MKTQLKTILATLALATATRAPAQGTFDQQSATESVPGGIGFGIQSQAPIGQSFTPSLSGVSFIRLWVYDLTPANGMGATLYVNLRADSITGAVLGSTDPVFLPDSFGASDRGFANFFFPTTVSLTPGTTYFFEPVVQSGDAWGIFGHNSYNYAGGTAFFNGIASAGDDLWFAEGVVPEPSTFALATLAALVLFGAKLGRRKDAHGSIPWR